MSIAAQRRSAFTLVEIMIVVAIIGLLAALAVPSLTKNREMAQMNAIISNLRVIDNAKDQWALEHRKGTGMTPSESDIDPYIKGGFPPKLVVDEEYHINPVGEPATATVPVRLGTNAPNSEISAY